MTNLEYLKKINKEDKAVKDIIALCDGNIKIDDFGYVYRQVKALEIIAEELCIANKKLTILVMGKLTVKKNKIKVSKVKYEFPPIEVECPEGFTNKGGK